MIANQTAGTDPRETQLHLQAQRMEAVANLAGGIAHDYNNLLMAIQGHATLMMMDKDPSDPDLEHLRVIEGIVATAAAITTELLGFAGFGKCEVQRTNLNEFLKNQTESFARTKKGITFHEKYPENLWPVAVDREQLAQAILQLYINSSETLADRGELHISTQNVILDDTEAKLLGLSSRKYVKISLRDEGTGMDDVTLEQIFDPFFSTNGTCRSGRGLGLAAVYGIIRNHGGFIDVHSSKGEGATFCVYLPASEMDGLEEKTAIPATEVRAETAGGNGKEQGLILLVDDDILVTEVAKDMLERLSYQVLTAGGGIEAIDILKENREKIDMVILDMMMPDMNGSETFDCIRDICPNMKVVLSSGYYTDDEIQKILKRGFSGFIQKPYTMEELSLKIRQFLKR